MPLQILPFAVPLLRRAILGRRQDLERRGYSHHRYRQNRKVVSREQRIMEEICLDQVEFGAGRARRMRMVETRRDRPGGNAESSYYPSAIQDQFCLFATIIVTYSHIFCHIIPKCPLLCAIPYTDLPIKSALSW